ncbi:hypothetical protein [Bacillus sp. Bos-x628]|uniref:hypothetical protein n=1 Tax=Bacillus maqinnsis TaxID=3229854 RepID=UPI00338EEEB6
MSLFTATGDQAKESASKKNVDLKTAYIRLKENESVRVRVLGLTDYVEYKSHGDYNLGIYNQPCLTPATGEVDPLCVAANSGVEGFDKLKAKKRYIFALYDIDMKAIRFWDASKTQANKLISEIEEYKDSIISDDYSDLIAFNFKRTGDKTETVYSLLPIMKLDKSGKEGFASGDEVKVELKDFESVLIPRTPEQQIEALKNAGFPVEDYFSSEEISATNVDGDENPTQEF